jgi:hypothetical protein
LSFLIPSQFQIEETFTLNYEKDYVILTAAVKALAVARLVIVIRLNFMVNY